MRRSHGKIKKKRMAFPAFRMNEINSPARDFGKNILKFPAGCHGHTIKNLWHIDPPVSIMLIKIRGLNKYLIIFNKGKWRKIGYVGAEVVIKAIFSRPAFYGFCKIPDSI